MSILDKRNKKRIINIGDLFQVKVSPGKYTSPRCHDWVDKYGIDFENKISSVTNIKTVTNKWLMRKLIYKFLPLGMMLDKVSVSDFTVLPKEGYKVTYTYRIGQTFSVFVELQPREGTSAVEFAGLDKVERSHVATWWL